MKYFSMVLLFITCTFSVNGQILITAEKGYTPQVGVVVSMLNSMSDRVESRVKDLSIEETDFLLDENANSIGTLIMHLAATEKLYQVMTFENRELNEEEEKEWSTAMSMGKDAQEKYNGNNISDYLKVYKDVRAKTLEYLIKKDDAWLATVDEKLNMNYHWAWFHVMEHQSSHLGQILLISKRIPE